MHVIFANTGVQIICVPIQAGRRFTTAQIGYGWQQCLCKDPAAGDDDDGDNEDSEPVKFPYIQWQLIQSAASKLFLAVDTSLGDPDVGYFCDPTSLHGDFNLALDGLLDRSGKPLQGLPKIEIVLRASTATAGEAKPVHMVVDFGNSRTGALLLELSGEVASAAKMLPFELRNRYTLDDYNDEGEQVSVPAHRWFSSKTRWCNNAFLPPQEMTKKEYYRESVKGLFGSKQVTQERETFVRPDLFDDWSMVRMGAEADDVCQVMHAKGEFRTGVSSPKRYLWADDDSWLEGAFWYMADPHDMVNSGVFASKLQGPLLRFVHEDDRDFLLSDKPIRDDAYATEVPIKPRHAPRSMMVMAIYEMLCQAYAFTNSLYYRTGSGDAARSREIRSLTLTFPSGMFQPERERLADQVQKGINIFSRTVGKFQKVKPTIKLSIDEASAVHLTYIWAELQMLGQDPRLWFAALGRSHQPRKAKKDAAEEESEDAQLSAAPAGRRRSKVRPRRPGGKAGGGAADEEPEDSQSQHEIRMACIDIGGGTTDMMIARYTYQPGIDDSIQGQVMHQDGISIAGDHLVKRLLEKIIVPHFVEALGIEDEDVQLLFGPEVPKNRAFASQRIDWVNRLFVPLAEHYLQFAVDSVEDDEISHDDPEIVDPAVLESLEQVCNKLRGAGYYNIQQPLGLKLDKGRFEELVHEVFDDLLYDFCSRIVEHDTDVILLAGQPTKLEYIQNLVQMYVPLPASRIIPMFNHYAGNWYPYQDAKGHAPGLIVDPKSAVVVGAAIEFMARNGMLPQFRFNMTGKEHENTYYWGVMTESTNTIREERILFHASEDEDVKDEWTEFTTIAQRVMIGRKMVPDEDAQANPIYVIKMDTQNRIGETEVTIRIRRNRSDSETGLEEHLEVESVMGTVAGETAVLGENVQFKWRTLADERFFLDTGGLDNIEVGGGY